MYNRLIVSIRIVYFFREDIPSVFLYDTSGDTDININATILSTIEAEGGGIGSPRPSPHASASATPTRVLSPAPTPIHEDGDNTNNSPDVKQPSIEKRLSEINFMGDSSHQSAISQSVTTQQSNMADTNTSMADTNTSNVDHRNKNSMPVNGAIQSDSEHENKREITPREVSPFRIPNVGDYLEVHVNFIHDPWNFVVSW